MRTAAEQMQRGHKGRLQTRILVPFHALTQKPLGLGNGVGNPPSPTPLPRLCLFVCLLGEVQKLRAGVESTDSE